MLPTEPERKRADHPEGRVGADKANHSNQLGSRRNNEIVKTWKHTYLFSMQKGIGVTLPVPCRVDLKSWAEDWA